MESGRVDEVGNTNATEKERYVPPHLRRPERAQPSLPPSHLASDRGRLNAFPRGRGEVRTPYAGRGSDSGFANGYDQQRSSTPYRGRFSYDRRCALFELFWSWLRVLGRYESHFWAIEAMLWTSVISNCLLVDGIGIGNEDITNSPNSSFHSVLHQVNVR